MICYITHFRYGGNAKVVHFLGKTKPWSYTFDPKAKQIAGSVHEATSHPTFLLDWWTLYSSTVVPMLQEQYGDQPFQSGCVEVNEHTSLFFQSCIYTTHNLVNLSWTLDNRQSLRSFKFTNDVIYDYVFISLACNKFKLLQSWLKMAKCTPISFNIEWTNRWRE